MSLALEYWWRTMNATPPLPPIPTRQLVCQFQGSMQGLMVETSYGSTPYWEGIVGWFDSMDRRSIYAAKMARGDRHCGVQLSGAYKEPGQFYANFPGRDWTSDLPGFRALLGEVVQAGFLPWVPLAGDGLTFDTVGLTYGWSWLMANLARILTALKDLEPYILYSPGYDGVIGYDERTQQFGPWSLNDLDDFIVSFRTLAPNGHLSVEPSAGPLNGTLPRFLSFSAYDGLDVVLNELNQPPHDDVTWQGAARLLGPSYMRPPDQPPHDDPDAPFGPNSPKWSCKDPTSRGLIYGCAFEWATYDWVRNRVSSADVQANREYLLKMGYPTSG